MRTSMYEHLHAHSGPIASESWFFFFVSEFILLMDCKNQPNSFWRSTFSELKKIGFNPWILALIFMKLRHEYLWNLTCYYLANTWCVREVSLTRFITNYTNKPKMSTIFYSHIKLLCKLIQLIKNLWNQL